MPSPALLVVAFAVGAMSVFFDVAYQASLVRLLSPALMALSPLARLGREIPAVRSSGDVDR